MFLFSVWSLCEDHLGEEDGRRPRELHPLHTGPRLWKVRIIPLRFFLVCLGWDQTSDLPRTGGRSRHVPGRESSPSCITSRGTLAHVRPSKHHVIKRPRGIHLQLFDCGFGSRPASLAKLEAVVFCRLPLQLRISLRANYWALSELHWEGPFALPIYLLCFVKPWLTSWSLPTSTDIYRLQLRFNAVLTGSYVPLSPSMKSLPLRRRVSLTPVILETLGS